MQRSRRWVPTERDKRIVAAVYVHRALTSDLVSLLFWGKLKSETPCDRRLKRLSDHSFLERQEQERSLGGGRSAYIYFLDRAGLTAAAEVLDVGREDIDWKKPRNHLKWPFVNHLLHTNFVRVRIERMAPERGLQLHQWLDDQVLGATRMRDPIRYTDARGVQRNGWIHPDSYLALRVQDTGTLHRAFLEIDCATESLRVIENKVCKYLAYFASQAFRARYHAKQPFRVLLVTTSEARMHNMKQLVEDLGDHPHFWFSTFDALHDPGHVLRHASWLMAGADTRVPFPIP